MAATQRYSRIAILLHWSIALLILLLVPMGWWMTRAIEAGPDQALAYRAYQVHKALGFLVLALTVVRIGWRLGHKPPQLPPAMKRWEAAAARVTHGIFYILLLALPLSGWVYVSSGWAIGRDSALLVPTSWFGLFPVPHLGFVTTLGEDARRAVAFRSNGAHQILAWGMVALLALHVAAALKHHLVDRDGVLGSMIPALARRQEAASVAASDELKERSFPLALVAAGAVVALLALAGAVTHGPPARQIAVAAPVQPSSEQPASAPEALQKEAASPDNAASAIDNVQEAAAEQPASASAWAVDPAASVIRFSGTHAGAQFAGAFTSWKADIKFDPADLKGSTALIDIRTGSAVTGDPTQEGSLKGTEWFDPDQYPTATFRADSFTALGGDRYRANGTLKVKTVTVPVTLPFTFTEKGGVATVRGKVVLDRIALKLGLVSDAAAQWVSKDIHVEIEVRAKRAG